MKKAILVVSFGVTNPEIRERCLETCENKIKLSFHNYDIFRAYTSIRIIKKIKQKESLIINTPLEAMENLIELGYEEVIVQPLLFTYGVEYKKIQDQIEKYQHKFTRVILGKPLVTNQKDMIYIVNSIKEQLPSLQANEALVLMGHGTAGEDNIIYSKLEESFRTNGVNAFVGTLKGEYTIDIIIESLKRNSIKNVILMPLLITIGHHVMEDMIGDNKYSWSNALYSADIKVNIKLLALGEIPTIGDYYVELVKKSLL